MRIGATHIKTRSFMVDQDAGKVPVKRFPFSSLRSSKASTKLSSNLKLAIKEKSPATLPSGKYSIQDSWY